MCAIPIEPFELVTVEFAQKNVAYLDRVAKLVRVEMTDPVIKEALGVDHLSK